MSKEIRSLIELFFRTLHKDGTSCMSVIGKNGEGCVSIVGSTAEVSSGLANCFEAVKKGQANEGQQAIYNIILDVIAVTLSMSELRQLLPPRVDRLLR